MNYLESVCSKIIQEGLLGNSSAAAVITVRTLIRGFSLSKMDQNTVS